MSDDEFDFDFPGALRKVKEEIAAESTAKIDRVAAADHLESQLLYFSLSVINTSIVFFRDKQKFEINITNKSKTKQVTLNVEGPNEFIMTIDGSGSFCVPRDEVAKCLVDIAYGRRKP